MTKEFASTDLEVLDRSITLAQRLVSLTMLATLSAYIYWFWIHHGLNLANDAGAWGQFGDFIGGMLNPLVAYAAFYWLTRSVRLQKEELAETRKALAEASEAQREQAAHAQTSVRLNALGTLTESIMSEVEAHRQRIQFLIDQYSRNPAGTGARALDGTWVPSSQIQEYVDSINKQVDDRLAERRTYEDEIRTLLEQSR